MRNNAVVGTVAGGRLFICIEIADLLVTAACFNPTTDRKTTLLYKQQAQSKSLSSVVVVVYFGTGKKNDAIRPLVSPLLFSFSLLSLLLSVTVRN